MPLLLTICHLYLLYLRAVSWHYIFCKWEGTGKCLGDSEISGKFRKTMENTEEKYMRAALGQAALAYEDDEVPVGAVIVCNGRIIARAYNMTERLKDPTAHAEMQAITMATEYLGGKYLTECELYVTVEPCPMCAAALGWAQIRKVVYGAPDPKKGFTLYSPSLLHPKTSVVSGVLAEECARLMSDFFKGKR